jgi:hypothetical protein
VKWSVTFAIGGTVAAALIIFEYMNFHEFCYSEWRYLGDRAIIDAAIRYQIQLHDYLGATRKFTSVEEFRAINSICCSLDKWGDRRYSILRRRALGQELMVVDVWYRFKDTGPKQYWKSHMLIDACGNIPRNSVSGYETDEAPRRSWGGNTYE